MSDFLFAVLCCVNVRPTSSITDPADYSGLFDDRLTCGADADMHKTLESEKKEQARLKKENETLRARLALVSPPGPTRPARKQRPHATSPGPSEKGFHKSIGMQSPEMVEKMYRRAKNMESMSPAGKSESSKGSLGVSSVSGSAGSSSQSGARG